VLTQSGHLGWDATLKELKNELKLRNAKGLSKKNKAELIQQLEEICQQGNI